MKRRIVEFIFLLALSALIVQYTTKKDSPDPAPSPAASTAAPAGGPLNIGDMVGSFTLAGEHGEVTHREGEGPLFITLTATGCADCLMRIDHQDREAYQAARTSGLEVWNLLVYHPSGQVAGFVAERRPSADQVLADPSSQISVSTLGGSDATCWLLLDREGRLAYRGPVDLARLKDAIEKL